MPGQLSLGSSKQTKRPCLTSARRQGTYSVMILSAHSTSETKIFGLPNFAPILGQVCFGYSSGTRARSTGVDWYLLRDDLGKNLGQGWPAERNNCIGN